MLMVFLNLGLFSCTPQSLVDNVATEQATGGEDGQNPDDEEDEDEDNEDESEED